MLDDILTAVAATEAPAGLKTPNGGLSVKLTRLYRAALVEAARVFRKPQGSLIAPPP